MVNSLLEELKYVHVVIIDANLYQPAIVAAGLDLLKDLLRFYFLLK